MSADVSWWVGWGSGVGCGLLLSVLIDTIQAIRQRKRLGWNLQAGIVLEGGPLAGRGYVVSYGESWKDETIEVATHPEGIYVVDWSTVRYPRAVWQEKAAA